jgi:Amt family ammonium transporter
VSFKYRFGFDDSLDVVGIHLVGGVIGSLIIGLLATATVTGEAEGLFYGGGLAQLGKQAIAVGAVGGYSFVVTLIIGFIVDKTIGFRITRDDELAGVDETTHAETAYDNSALGGGSGGSFSAAAPQPTLRQGVSA